MSGYLEVKYPFKSNLGLNPFKTWKRQWCILRPSPTCSGGGSLAVYCSEAGAAAGAVELPPDSVVRRAKSRSRPHAFAVFSLLEPHKPRILLAAPSLQDAQQWMDKIRALLDGKQLLGSELRDSFSVTIMSTELSRKLSLCGDGQLTISSDGVFIIRPQGPRTLVPWQHIKQVTHSVDNTNKICVIGVHSGFHAGGSLTLSTPLAAELAAALTRDIEGPAKKDKRLSRSEGDLHAASGDLGDARRSSWSTGEPPDVALDDTDLAMLKGLGAPGAGAGAALSRCARAGHLPSPAPRQVARLITETGDDSMSDRRSLLSIASGIYEEIPDLPEQLYTKMTRDEVDCPVNSSTNSAKCSEVCNNSCKSQCSGVSVERVVRLEEPTYESVAECVYATMRRTGKRCPPPPLPPRLPFGCKLWIVASGRPELAEKSAETLNNSYRLCDLHFTSTDLLKKKLKRNAVPTQNLPQAFLDRTKYTQTEYSIPPCISTPNVASGTTKSCVSGICTRTKPKSSCRPLENNALCKRKLLKEYKNGCKKRKILKSPEECMADQIECDVSPALKKMFDIRNQLQVHCRNNRYEKTYKLFALNIYFASPLAYRILANTLCLPSERSLRRMNIDIGTKLHDDAFNCLESKLKNLEESGKYCIISAAETSLKPNLFYHINKDKIVGFHEIDGVQTTEPATRAYVVMASGIYSNWKQPLAYCFSAKSTIGDKLKIWLDDLIYKMLDIGFHVVAFVSDESSSFIKLAEERNVSADKPYFFIGGKKIYNIFDIPHLIKSVRNNLMKYDFQFMDNDKNKLTAKWDDVKVLYNHDRERTLRLTPKLTESHINPNNLEKTKMKYATQVFSNSVVAAMSFSIECNRLTKSASGTVKLTELMDKSFDVLNSSKVNDPNKYKLAFDEKPHQTEIIDRLNHFLSNVTIVDVKKKDITNSVKFLEAWKITINSIRSLAKDLKSEGFRFLFTSRLNQDALDNFLVSVRQQGENCGKPTPVQFGRACNKLFMTNLLRHSNRANCAKDLDKFLTDTDNIGTHIETNAEPTEKGTNSLVVQTTDYRFDLPEKNAFLYACGYLLKKCEEVHKCEKILHYMNSNNQLLDDDFFSIKKFIVKKNSFNLEEMVLFNPPESFVTCVKSMDDKFKLVFEEKNLNLVGNKILKEIGDVVVTDCCECFPNGYLRKLFIRWRIYNTLKANNRAFKDKRKYFSVCNI